MQGLCKHITEISGHDRFREQGQPAAGQAVGRAHGGHALHAARAQEHCDGSRLESGAVVTETPFLRHTTSHDFTWYIVAFKLFEAQILLIPEWQLAADGVSGSPAEAL